MSQTAPQFRDISDDELRGILQAAAAGPTSAGNVFFGSFKYVHDLHNGLHSAALHQGLALLSRCQALDSAAYAKIHKGTAYYWLGTACFLVHDYQTAVFFYDAAVSEDLRAGHDPLNNSTPSFKFILLEGADSAQAAKPLVEASEARTREIIDDYNTRSGKPASLVPLTLDQVRSSFLRPAVSTGNDRWRSLATALISFILEWDYRNALLDLRPGTGTVEPFFIHLFKGCLLFESLLKANPASPPPAGTLGTALQHLHVALGIPQNTSIGNTDLPAIIASLPPDPASVPEAIAITGRIRNTVGHDLGWQVRLDKLTYHRLFRMIACSCLHAISALYVPQATVGA